MTSLPKIEDSNKMAASHAGLLLVSSSPGQLQMSCTIDFLALPLTKTIVGVWWLGDLSKKVEFQRPCEGFSV